MAMGTMKRMHTSSEKEKFVFIVEIFFANLLNNLRILVGEDVSALVILSQNGLLSQQTKENNGLFSLPYIRQRKKNYSLVYISN